MNLASPGIQKKKKKEIWYAAQIAGLIIGITFSESGGDKEMQAL